MGQTGEGSDLRMPHVRGVTETSYNEFSSSFGRTNISQPCVRANPYSGSFEARRIDSGEYLLRMGILSIAARL